MTNQDIAHQRLRNHHLIGSPLAQSEDVVGWLGAVQAQEYAVAKWGIAQRTVGTTSAAVDRLLGDGIILRTHLLRPTWHFVLPADIRWILELTAPRVHAANAPYYRKMELDDALFARGIALLATALRDGNQLTRAELATVLQDGGIAASGMRLAYLLMHAELDAVICSGARRGKQFTYALFDERVPETRPMQRDEALAELARRYFASHGPATPHDFAWWSGLTVTDARRGAELARPELSDTTVDGKTYWSPASTPAAGEAEDGEVVVHLLPVYDEYLGSYRDHSPTFDAALLDRPGAPSDALMGNILVVDGMVVGGWRREPKTKEVVVSIDALIPLGEAERVALIATAERYGRFMELPVTVQSDSQRS